MSLCGDFASAMQAQAIVAPSAATKVVMPLPPSDFASAMQTHAELQQRDREFAMAHRRVHFCNERAFARQQYKAAVAKEMVPHRCDIVDMGSDFCAASDFGAALQITDTIPRRSVVMLRPLPRDDFAAAIQTMSSLIHNETSTSVPRVHFCNERAYARQMFKAATTTTTAAIAAANTTVAKATPMPAGDFADAMRALSEVATQARSASTFYTHDFAEACRAQAELANNNATPLVESDNALFSLVESTAPLPCKADPIPAMSVCNERAVFAAEAKRARKELLLEAQAQAQQENIVNTTRSYSKTIESSPTAQPVPATFKTATAATASNTVSMPTIVTVATTPSRRRSSAYTTEDNCAIAHIRRASQLANMSVTPMDMLAQRGRGFSNTGNTPIFIQ